ncbi:hypothetical protein GJ744_011817 [Endocarpon pusillum]|uniref:Mannosyltransferase n=1 Tax=Endocarpon pusillum TaxID=364733 RepID=A0A8H7E4H4_9EURO|nr:hypothetical protein GJ744_011817 [Endocarpon pusillum]
MSTSSSDLSAASANAHGKLKSSEGRQSRQRKAHSNVAHSPSQQDILLFLLAFRILNALTIRTFFQPDEYFQSLEPAWQMVFGENCGAWITWEWKNALRSAIHPAIFATIYYLTNLGVDMIRLTPATRAELLLAAPKLLQAFFAALGDYYTWQLAQRVFGHHSCQVWATLALTVLSPWQWFCSTRTLSNSLETTLTVAALYNWPWQWSLGDRGHARYDDRGLRKREDIADDAVDETTRLRRCLLLAALATILRPTNLLIWISVAAMTCLNMSSVWWYCGFARSPWKGSDMSTSSRSISFLRATTRERSTLFWESFLCGSTVLILSVFVDRFYYQFWTFPPLKFLYFNLVQSLSVFYGKNDWHYYLSQGFPLLLITALPFTLVGLYNGLLCTDSSITTLTRTILSQIATISCIVPTALSLISHKEVRFIYPLLPLLHILAAGPLIQFFAPSFIHAPRSRHIPPNALLKRLVLCFLILLNATIAIYTTTIHGRGVIDVLSYLRHQHETFYLSSQTHNPNRDPNSNMIANKNLTAAFLMPCHSTPWRSHLIHPGISAWALTCEPPLHLSAGEKASYIDEADAFYSDPLLWIRRNMSRQPPPPRAGVFTARDKQNQHRRLAERNDERKRAWPDYLIFFSAAEQIMDTALQGSGYSECWRGFNSHWHDDLRRRGDVVVWCLFPERKIKMDHKDGMVGLIHKAKRLLGCA